MKLTVFGLCAYPLAFGFYIHWLTHPEIGPIEYCKSFYYITTLLFMWLIVYNLKKGCESYYHEQFADFCIIIISINFILQALTHLKVIPDSQDEFKMFNGSIFVTTLIIGISFLRHGYFSKKYNG